MRLFTIAPALDELLLQRTDLLVQQVIRLMDQADESVNHDLRIAVLQPSGAGR